MSIKIKVRATSETVVGDVEIQHQRDRARRVRKVGSQLKTPTIPTPAFSSCVVFWLYVLCGKGQQVDQPPSRESFWYPSERYK